MTKNIETEIANAIGSAYEAIKVAAPDWEPRFEEYAFIMEQGGGDGPDGKMSYKLGYEMRIAPDVHFRVFQSVHK